MMRRSPDDKKSTLCLDGLAMRTQSARKHGGERLASAAISAGEIAPSHNAHVVNGWMAGPMQQQISTLPENCIKIIYSYAGDFQAAGY